MAVTANDIVIYGSAVMPTGDTALPGGAINTGIKMTFTDMSVNTGLSVSSNGASDSFQVSVTGRNAGGSIVTDTFLVNNTLARVSGDSATQFNRILRAVVSSGSHTGTISIEQNDTPTYSDLATMEIGINNIYRPFYNVSSAVGNAKEYFEKVFVKNNSSTNNLLSASVSESGEIGFSGKITFDLSATGSDDGQSSNNRRGPPPATQLLSGTTGSWDDNTKNVVGGDLIQGSGQGIWMRLLLPTAESSDSGIYAFTIAGNTTA